MDRLYSAEEREWLAGFIPGHSHKEIICTFNARFDTQLTESRLKRYLSINNLTTGRSGRFEAGHVPSNKGRPWGENMTPEGRKASQRTQFKPGHRPVNTLPLGAEVKRQDGYLYRKVAETKPARYGWRQVHRILYEEAFGPVPEGMTVSFIDGNPANIVLSNLRLVSRGDRVRVAKKGLTGATVDVLLIAGILAAVGRRQRRESMHGE
jgi:hypothetical protein